MKRFEIKKNNLLEQYLKEVFSECKRESLINFNQTAILFSSEDLSLPNSLDGFSHGSGNSPSLSSGLMAKYLIDKHKSLSVKVDNRYAKPSDGWIKTYTGTGSINLNEEIVGIFYNTLDTANSLSDVILKSVELPYGLIFLFNSKQNAQPAKFAHSIIVTGVFDGEAFLLIEN